jgi:hypothetical protein
VRRGAIVPGPLGEGQTTEAARQAVQDLMLTDVVRRAAKDVTAPDVSRQPTLDVMLRKLPVTRRIAGPNW